jgi:hypothetical protein
MVARACGIGAIAIGDAGIKSDKIGREAGDPRSRGVPMLKAPETKQPISEMLDDELLDLVENSSDAIIRGVARAQLELRSHQRGRRVADRQLRIAWLAVISACASAIAALAAMVIAWIRL